MFRYRGAVLRGYNVPPDTTHLTIHVFHLDEISSDDQDRGSCLYARCVQSAECR
jgi:hypothetical protein